MLKHCFRDWSGVRVESREQRVVNEYRKNMSYALLEELLPFLKEYERQKIADVTSIDDFLAWMQKQRETEVSLEEAEAQQLNGHISRHIGELYKHAKGYMKKAFSDTPFVSADDFAYLATLMREGSMRKTELIYENIGEVSPGMEVIKRLLKNGFIRDFPDPDDKRSRRVELTEAGKKAFFDLLQKMNVAGDIIVGDLSVSERLQLLSMLKRLRRFHRDIFEESRNEPLLAIREQYVS